MTDQKRNIDQKAFDKLLESKDAIDIMYLIKELFLDDSNKTKIYGVVERVIASKRQISIKDNKNSTIICSVSSIDNLFPNKVGLNDEIELIGQFENGMFKTDLLYQTKYREMIQTLINEERFDLIDTFLNLAKNKKDTLHSLFNPTFSAENVSEISHELESINEIHLKFIFSQYQYSNEQRKKINQLFIDLKRSSIDRTITITLLKYILKIDERPFTYKPNSSNRHNYQEILRQMNSIIYGLDNIKQKLARLLSLYLNHGIKSDLNILLVGSPGIGKTSIFESISEITDIPYKLISCGNLRGRGELVGIPNYYKDSKPGTIAQTFYENATTSVIFILDELDKLPVNNPEGNPTDTLLEIIGDQKRLNEVYLDYTFNISNTLFFATANSIDTIPDALLNRFWVINIQDYSTFDKIQIANLNIIPALLKNYQIQDRILFQDEVIEYIINCYCEDDGVRELKRCLTKIIMEETEELISNPNQIIHINKDHIKKHLGDVTILTQPKAILRNYKKNYPITVLNHLNTLLRQRESMSLRIFDDSLINRQINFLINIYKNDHIYSAKDLALLYQGLDKKLIGQSHLKLKIAHILEQSSNNESKNILILGGNGSGKSKIAVEISNVINKVYVKIDLSQIHDERLLLGSQTELNIISETMYKNSTSHIVLILEHVDRIKSSIFIEKNLIESILFNLSQKNRILKDNFIAQTFNISNVLVIATANNIKDVPKKLLRLFEVVEIQKYSLQEITLIITNIVNSEIKDKFRYLDDIYFSNEIILFLVNEINETSNITFIIDTLYKLYKSLNQESYSSRIASIN